MREVLRSVGAGALVVWMSACSPEQPSGTPDGGALGTDAGPVDTDAAGVASDAGAPVDPPTGGGPLEGSGVWDRRVEGSEVQMGTIDMGQMKLAFGMDNARCHYVWNETTRSDFHTECTYTVDGDMLTFTATADSDGTAAGWSCAHPDWTNWNDRPAVQYGRFGWASTRTGGSAVA